MITASKLLIFVLISLLSVECVLSQDTLLSPTAEKENDKNQFGSMLKDTATSSIFTYHIINAPHDTYGYDILVNDKIVIHQTSVPGLAGISGFKNQSAALKIAELVIEKIKNGQMPPTITKAEIAKAYQ